MRFTPTPHDTDRAPLLKIAIRYCGVAIVAWSAALGTGAMAADPATSNYERERAACLSGESHQDRATCLREAGAARDEAKRGNLNDRGGAFDQNALNRCNSQPAADREDCRRRIMGDGTSSGSVGGGGVLREVVTPINQDGTPIRPPTSASPPQ